MSYASCLFALHSVDHFPCCIYIVNLYRENRGNEESEIFIVVSFAKKGGNNAKSYIVYVNKRVFLFLFIFRNIVGH